MFGLLYAEIDTVPYSHQKALLYVEYRFEFRAR